MVLIGVDPHKGSHTAVVVDGDEHELGRLTVRADRRQLQRMLTFAAPFGERTWAIESASGLGFLLAQQLVAAGEDVVDVPPTLAARVRLLGSGRGSKNDPNDALSTAIAALRDPHLRTVVAEDYAMVLRMLADRYQDLTSLRTQAVCRLHALLAALVPGGVQKRLSANAAAAFLRRVHPVSAVEVERKNLALELRRRHPPTRPDGQDRESQNEDRGRRVRNDGHQHLRCRTDHRRHDHRARRRHHPVPDRRALRQLQRHRTHRSVVRTEECVTGSTRAATGSSTTPCTSPPSCKPAVTPQAASTSNANSPRARPRKRPYRALKRRISDAVYKQLRNDRRA